MTHLQNSLNLEKQYSCIPVLTSIFLTQYVSTVIQTVRLLIVERPMWRTLQPNAVASILEVVALTVYFFVSTPFGEALYCFPNGGVHLRETFPSTLPRGTSAYNHRW